MLPQLQVTPATLPQPVTYTQVHVIIISVKGVIDEEVLLR